MIKTAIILASIVALAACTGPGNLVVPGVPTETTTKAVVTPSVVTPPVVTPPVVTPPVTPKPQGPKNPDPTTYDTPGTSVGNPGNTRSVGRAGETPNRSGTWDRAGRGRSSDIERPSRGRNRPVG